MVQRRRLRGEGASSFLKQVSIPAVSLQTNQQRRRRRDSIAAVLAICLLDIYASVIMPFLLVSYKRIRSSATVSVVSIRCSSAKRGISGISESRCCVIRISEWIRAAFAQHTLPPKRSSVNAIFQHPRLITLTNGQTSAAWDWALVFDVSLRQVAR